MQRAIVDLIQSRPHVHDSAPMTATELAAYQRGYYTALTYALRVVDLAETNYKRATVARRAATRRKRSA